jgi:alginate O-acetyltransferase complex protein AlgI
MSTSASFLDVRFLLLLLVLGTVRWIWPTRNFAFLGAIASAAVVLYAAPATFVVISALTLGVLFPLHRLMHAAHTRNWSTWVRRSLLAIAVGSFVGLLIVSKAYRFFTIPGLTNARFTAEIASLIGFSYFIFRAIDFLHIQSILRFKEHRPWTLLFYTLFPPTITSGPIQKFQDFKLQIGNPVPLSGALLTAVGYRLTRGYFRKVVLAFVLNEWVTRLLAVEAPTIVVSISIVVLLYLYFYFDFAGYSDIAIALGLLLGIKVPENFRKPFLATTVSEFWRNWHITLVDWFRDHVFIPLGGMQSSRQRAAILAFLVMVLCGFWHGLTWNFVLWGTLHGAALFAEAMLGTKPIPPSLRHGGLYWWRVLWTNSRVALASILFLPNAETIRRILGGFLNLGFR